MVIKVKMIFGKRIRPKKFRIDAVNEADLELVIEFGDELVSAMESKENMSRVNSFPVNCSGEKSQ